jgi:hypothetical protein
LSHIFEFNFSDEGKGMRDTRAREEAALARLNQSYGFLLNNGITEGMKMHHVSNLLSTDNCDQWRDP